MRRQHPHLLRDHCEALARFAGLRGLDRGVQRQHVGLKGDHLDFAGHLAQLAGVLHQRTDFLRQQVAAVLNGLEGVDDVHQIALALARVGGERRGITLLAAGVIDGRIQVSDDATEALGERDDGGLHVFA